MTKDTRDEFKIIQKELDDSVITDPVRREQMIQPFIDKFSDAKIILSDSEKKMIKNFISGKIKLSDLTDYFSRTERLRSVLEEGRLK